MEILIGAAFAMIFLIAVVSISGCVAVYEIYKSFK